MLPLIYQFGQARRFSSVSREFRRTSFRICSVLSTLFFQDEGHARIPGVRLSANELLEFASKHFGTTTVTQRWSALAMSGLLSSRTLKGKVAAAYV